MVLKIHRTSVVVVPINRVHLHDLTGHYNRFDIFSFKVNEKELSPLSADRKEDTRAVSFPKKNEKVSLVEAL